MKQTLLSKEIAYTNSHRGEKKEYLFKILVIGELGTGKTSIIKRYVHQFFSQHYRPTIGLDFACKVINWDAETIVRLLLWEFAGQERFDNMPREYYKDAVGVFIVFDSSRVSTFDTVTKWKNDLDLKVQLPDGNPVPCVLLANKFDQPKDGLMNNTSQIDDFCKENGFIGWFETSAKENINIDDSARFLVTQLLQNDETMKSEDCEDKDRIQLDDVDGPQTKDKKELEADLPSLKEDMSGKLHMSVVELNPASTMDEFNEVERQKLTNRVEKKEHLLKILVIGELGTGKTSIIKRYVHQLFSQHYRPTIGVDFTLSVINWDAETIVRLQLWDIAGQERFGNMTRVYYKEAVGAFIVFDLSRASTFDAVTKWKNDLDLKVQLPDGNPVPCVLLANKCDQPKEGLMNNTSQIDDFCKEKGFIGWFKTSAKENINIDDSARFLINQVLQNDKGMKSEDVKDKDRIQLDDVDGPQTKDKKGCC